MNANAIAGLLRDIHGRLNIKLKQRSETLRVSETHAARFRVMQPNLGTGPLDRSSRDSSVTF